MVDVGVSKDALRAVIPLTGEFVGPTDTQVVTGKTVNTTDNTLTATSQAAGDILKNDGTKFVRLARGSANQPLKVNSGGTDVEYGVLAVAGGGSGGNTATGVLIGNGTSPYTTKTNPTGAFLGDSDVQNVTGGKTFTDQVFKLRNPANTQTLTFRNPVLTSSQDYRFNSTYTYMFFLDGSTYYAKNGITKAIDYSGADAGAVVNSALTAATAGGLFLFAPHIFRLDTKISIPIGATLGARKPYVLKGTRTPQRETGTTLETTTAFTDQNFMIDASVTAASSKTAILSVSDMYFYNPYPWTGGAPTSTDKRVGGILYGSDNLSTTANIRTCNIDHCEFQYFWKGVDLQGAVYGAYLDHLVFSSASTTFKGEYDLKMEKGGLADIPKSCHIGSLFSTIYQFMTTAGQ